MHYICFWDLHIIGWMCLSVTVLGLKLAKALNKYNMLFANDAILVIKIFSSDIISSIKKDISQFS